MVAWDWDYEGDTLVHLFTVNGIDYRAELSRDEFAESPRDWDRDACQFLTFDNGRHFGVDETDGDHGNALARFLEAYGSDDTGKVLRAFGLWATITGSSWRAFEIGGTGYSQSDWWSGIALVNGQDVGNAEQFATGEADNYTAWMFGDVMVLSVFGPDGKEVEDSGLGGIYPDGAGSFTYSSADEYALEWAEADAAKRVQEANTVGAGIVGII